MPAFVQRMALIVLAGLCLIPLCLISGCSHEEAVEDAAASDQMLTVLKTALDAWKEGAAAALAQRNPPIRFDDDDLAAGRQLAAYTLDDPDAAVLPFESVYVKLTLLTADGKTFERKVGYQIALEPALAVLRSEP